jgi:hypothetical protein
MYQNYKSWYEAEGNIHTIGQRVFTQRLSDKGFTDKKKHGVMYWLGLRLREEDEFLDEVEPAADSEPEVDEAVPEPQPTFVVPAVMVAGVVPSISELASMPGGSYIV